MNLTSLSLYLLINLVLGLPIDAVEPQQRGRGMGKGWGRALRKARKGGAWIATDQTLADASSSNDFPTEFDTSLPEDTIPVQYSHEILPERIDDQNNQGPKIDPWKADQDHTKSQTDKYDKTAQYDGLKSTPVTSDQGISNRVMPPQTENDKDARVQHSSAKESMKDLDQHDLQQEKGNETNVLSADAQKESSPSQPENINKSGKENSNSTPAQPQTPGKNDKSKDSPNSSLPSSNQEPIDSTKNDTIWAIVGGLFGILAVIIGAATYNHFRKEGQGNQRPESSSSYNSDAGNLVFPPVPVDKSQIYYNSPRTYVPEIIISGPDSESHDYDVVISNN